MAETKVHPPGDKETEYKELGTFLRYLLDYRLKIFNFAVAFNGALLALIYTYIKTAIIGQILLCFLGLISSMVFLFLEKRIVFIYSQHLRYIMEVERFLDFGAVSKVAPRLKKGVITIRRCFLFLHACLLLIWLWQLVHFIGQWWHG